jgi:anti-sigma factor ChrR (cupin superfamily)
MNSKRERLDLDPNAGGAAYNDDDCEPEVNPDFSQRVIIDTEKLDWQSSPESGVDRKRLELIGKENQRLTTIVRFAPGSHFEAHGHDGGEEFYVLKGTFSDKSGNFHAGTYVRNPAGWTHAPWTDEGCEIFVKLRQFNPGDKERVVINTQKAEWKKLAKEGISVLPLHRHGDESVDLYRIDKDTELDLQSYPFGAELLIIEGELSHQDGIYRCGTWLRLPINTDQTLKSDNGCLFYLKTGHYPTILV